MKLVNKTQTVTLAEGCTVNPITGPPFHYIYGTNLGAPDFKKNTENGKKKNIFAIRSQQFWHITEPAAEELGVNSVAC